MQALPSRRSRVPARAAIQEAVTAHPWIWSFAAVLIEWALLGGITSRGFVGTMQAQITLVPYLVIVSVGQMLVITLGNGNIDLSIPYTMPLAAYFSIGVNGTGNGHLWAGIAVGLACGVVVGLVNSLGIIFLSIPPIVCTLAVGFLVQTATYVRGTNFNGQSPQSLVNVTLDKVGGIPVVTLACVAFSVVAAVLLHRSSYGRSVQAIGQNIVAAERAGLPLNRTIVCAYVLSGTLAALSGIFLAAFSGLSLDLGSTYLLTSVAAVVLGGALVSGGRSFVTGVWGGAIFLGLTVTLLAVIGASVAVQDMGEGVLILVVLLFAGRTTARDRE
jgi:ribose transport system permease protein